jgi:ABC-type branched-subunit amino acid transport system permease subunit
VIAWPILRLRGHYFTIAMLAVALVCAEIVSAVPLFQGAIGLDARAVRQIRLGDSAFTKAVQCLIRLAEKIVPPPPEFLSEIL